MAYNEQLNDRVREATVHLPYVAEKCMFGGCCFMVNGKMCMGVMKDELMCRIDPAIYDDLLEKNGCRPMAFTGRVMKGYILVSRDVLRTNKDLMYWLNLCLDYNPHAKAAKKKKTK